MEEGTVLCLLGPSGAGKTTAVRVLTTLLKPDADRAEVAGFDVVKQADELRSRIGLTGQYAAVGEYLTGWENLEMVARPTTCRRSRHARGPTSFWSASIQQTPPRPRREPRLQPAGALPRRARRFGGLALALV